MRGADRRPVSDRALRETDAVRQFLEALDVPLETDPELADTPARVLEAWKRELLAGYGEDPARILAEVTATKSAGASRDFVLVEGIATTVMCPHHLLPSSGFARVAYAPGERIVGLGALPRLVQCFARRLTLQETVCRSVADALIEHLGARAAACELDLAPGCVVARGAREPNARSRSLAMAGDVDADGFSAWFVRDAARRVECPST